MLIVDLAESEYHRHPALSQSGAKLLLPPSCPAVYRWQQDNPPEPSDKFDIGHAVHSLVLGVGAELVDLETDNGRLKATKDRDAEVRAAGKIPLMTAQYKAVHDMAAMVRQHPVAGPLLSGGDPELSLFWADSTRRGRLDYWRSDLGVIVDFKTTAGRVDRRSWSKTVADFGYHIQIAAYLEGVRDTGLHEDPAFLHVVQSKQPPYLVQVFEPTPDVIDVGAQLWRQAIDIYTECTATGVWPAYPPEIQPVSLPAWYTRTLESA